MDINKAIRFIENKCWKGSLPPTKAEISEELNVSEETIRRRLKDLVDRGEIKKGSIEQKTRYCTPEYDMEELKDMKQVDIKNILIREIKRRLKLTLRGEEPSSVVLKEKWGNDDFSDIREKVAVKAGMSPNDREFKVRFYSKVEEAIEEALENVKKTDCWNNVDYIENEEGSKNIHRRVSTKVKSVSSKATGKELDSEKEG